jgi:hypothetical protein
LLQQLLQQILPAAENRKTKTGSPKAGSFFVLVFFGFLLQQNFLQLLQQPQPRLPPLSPNPHGHQSHVCRRYTSN